MKTTKKQIFIGLLLTTFLITILNNCTENKNYQKKELDSYSLYSHRIDTFLTKDRDSLWDKYMVLQKELIGVQFDNFRLIDINGNEFELYSIETPVVFEVTSSWCRPCKASFPALNDLADKYDKKIKFIFITHDNKSNAETLAQKINKKIIIVPSDELVDITKPVKTYSGKFRHVFPFPTAFFLDENKRITQIKLGGPVAGINPNGGDTIITSIQEVYDINTEQFSTEIDKILQK